MVVTAALEVLLKKCGAECLCVNIFVYFMKFSVFLFLDIYIYVRLVEIVYNGAVIWEHEALGGRNDSGGTDRRSRPARFLGRSG